MSHFDCEKVKGKNFVLAVNGFASGNVQPLADFLNEAGAAKVFVIRHPLVKDQVKPHEIVCYENGKLKNTKKIRLPFFPPASYVFDLIVPKLPVGEKIDVWVGYNNLNTYRGIRHKKRSVVQAVVYMCIDFTPQRFGKKSPISKVYDKLDEYCLKYCDEIWSISDAAHYARLESLELQKVSPYQLVPMGANMEVAPKTSEGCFDKKQVVFLGHLLEKQGVQKVLDAFRAPELSEYRLLVMGTGPYLEDLKAKAAHLGINDRVQFTGFVERDEDIERMLSESTVAVAPYDPANASFTKYADAGKLKTYLGAGLPIVLTDVTPNAKDLAANAGSELVQYEPRSIKEGLLKVCNSKEQWLDRREKAITFGTQFDWNHIFANAFKETNILSS